LIWLGTLDSNFPTAAQLHLTLSPTTGSVEPKILTKQFAAKVAPVCHLWRDIIEGNSVLEVLSVNANQAVPFHDSWREAIKNSGRREVSLSFSGLKP
jgi:hypothetical protein